MIPLVEKEGFTFIINQKMLNKFKTKYVHCTIYLINAIDIPYYRLKVRIIVQQYLKLKYGFENQI